MRNITKLEPKLLQILPSLRQPRSLIKYKITFQIHGIKYLQVIKKSNIKTRLESTILGGKKEEEEGFNYLAVENTKHYQRTS